MKMKCLRTSMFRGDIVKTGTVLEVSDEEAKMDVVKAFFKPISAATAEESAAASTSAPKGLPTGARFIIAGLTRDQAIMKLNQAGAPVKGNMSNKALAELYETTFANIADATKKED